VAPSICRIARVDTALLSPKVIKSPDDRVSGREDLDDKQESGVLGRARITKACKSGLQAGDEEQLEKDAHGFLLD
jgi:hypothetical protein